MADIEITITIPDAKVARATDGFTRVHPIPDGVGPKEHVRSYILGHLRTIINAGLKQIDLEAQPPYVPPADDDGVVV